jgi:hypothetical protein
MRAGRSDTGGSRAGRRERQDVPRFRLSPLTLPASQPIEVTLTSVG